MTDLHQPVECLEVRVLQCIGAIQLQAVEGRRGRLDRKVHAAQVINNSIHNPNANILGI